MGTLSRPRRIDQKWKYLIEIDGIDASAWKSCSGISWESADVELWEGGNMIAFKEPGRITVPDVTLERGIGLDDDFVEWMEETVDFAANGGALTEDLKRNLDNIQQRRDNSEVRRITMYNAYGKGYTYGEWDSESDEPVYETGVLRYDFPKRASAA